MGQRFSVKADKHVLDPLFLTASGMVWAGGFQYQHPILSIPVVNTGFQESWHATTFTKSTLFL